jgi:hypothetical protein
MACGFGAACNGEIELPLTALVSEADSDEYDVRFWLIVLQRTCLLLSQAGMVRANAIICRPLLVRYPLMDCGGDY